MSKSNKSYNIRVPEQLKTYSPVNTPENVPDLEQEGVPRNIGPSTEYNQRETHIRRDNDTHTQVDLSRSFTDATEALILFIKEIIKPTLVINDELKEVPVLYVNTEKWASIQQYGFLRDERGKAMAPVISVRRTNFDNSYVSRMPGVRAYGNEVSLYTNYSNLNRYDNFNILNNQIPRKEIYAIGVPEWWKIDYEIIIWTNLITQVDKLIEDFYYYRGVPVGGKHGIRYLSNIKEVTSAESSNESGADRIVKSTLTFELTVPIIPAKSSDELNTKKEVSIGRVVFKEEKIIV